VISEMRFRDKYSKQLRTIMLKRLLELAGIEKIDEVGDHYEKLDDNQFNPDPYYARDVVWMGEKGRMIKLTPENSEPIWGNQFDTDKIRETAVAIRNSEERVKFNAPLVTPTIIDLENIADTIKGAAHNDLMWDPVIDGFHIFSTGDDDLDQYIVDEEQYLDDNAWDDEQRAELEQEMEQMKQDAISEQWGDIGDVFIQVRDGNHRRAAAFAYGEPFVYGLVVSNDGEMDAEWKPYLE